MEFPSNIALYRQASKRSLMVSKGIYFLNVLGKLFTLVFILQPYFVSHKEVLLVNYLRFRL